MSNNTKTSIRDLNIEELAAVSGGEIVSGLNSFSAEQVNQLRQSVLGDADITNLTEGAAFNSDATAALLEAARQDDDATAIAGVPEAPVASLTSAQVTPVELPAGADRATRTFFA